MKVAVRGGGKVVRLLMDVRPGDRRHLQAPKLLDLASKSRMGFGLFGMDTDIYKHGSSQDLCRFNSADSSRIWCNKIIIFTTLDNSERMCASMEEDFKLKLLLTDIWRYIWAAIRTTSFDLSASNAINGINDRLFKGIKQWNNGDSRQEQAGCWVPTLKHNK